MRKTISSLFIWAFFISFTFAQATEKSFYQTEDKKIYVNKELGIYLWLSTSPDENAEKVRLFSDSTKKFSNPMYFDTEGYNTVRSPSAVDTTTKRAIYPLRDIIFEVYADGIAPVTKALFKNSPKKILNGKTYYSSQLKIELKSYDAVSGISKLVYSLNGSSFAAYKEPLTGFKEGENTLKYYAADYVGNVEDTHEIVFYIDNIPPVTSYEIIGDVNEKYVSANASIKLSSEDNLAGVKGIYYRINNGPITNYRSPIPVKVLADNKSAVSYYAIDNIGNKEKAQIIGSTEGMQVEEGSISESNKLQFEFYVDKEPPELKMEVLEDSYKGKYQYVSTNSKFKIDATDSKSGVNTIKYSINTSSVDQIYKEPFSLDKKGLHYIRIQATDYVGNTSRTALHTYFCDPTPPQSNVTMGSPKYTSRDTLFISPKTKISLNAIDGIAGVSSTYYAINNEEPTLYSKSFSIDKQGFHRIRYASKDHVNNTEDDKILEVFVDGAGPKIHYHFSVESIGNKQVRDENYTIYPTNSLLYVAATDANVGGERIEYSINKGLARTENPIKLGTAGNYEITIMAYDVLGNSSKQDVKFAIEE